ncbi:MAG: serine protease [Bradyrhizobium sp.]
MPTRIDRYSLATVPIEQFFNTTKLGEGTGFIWQYLGRFYLVTNWHVISCRRFPTGENLLKHGGRPNQLQVLFNVRIGDFGKQHHTIHIRDTNGNPSWLIHPSRNVDIAVLPLPYDGKDIVFSLNPINGQADPDLFVGVGMDCYVLGYPFGSARPGFPVWKRGSIASEPDLARLTTDYILVDTASRPGMSGAPVIVRSWGFHLYDDGSSTTDEFARSKFIGVYSGRLVTRFREDAQIGMVWTASLIDEIIIGGRLDTD